MFKGKNALLENIIYLTVLGIHAFLFVYFLYISFFNYIIIIFSSLTIVSLITLAFYSFLTTKSYYYYLSIAIVICSAPIFFIVPLSIVLIVPELVILMILLITWLDQGTKYYYEMRVDKKANLFQHDPGVTHFRSEGPAALAFRMDEVWNPDSTLPMPNTDVSLDKSNLEVKMQIITSLLTSVNFICSIISVYNYINSILIIK